MSDATSTSSRANSWGRVVTGQSDRNEAQLKKIYRYVLARLFEKDGFVESHTVAKLLRIKHKLVRVAIVKLFDSYPYLFTMEQKYRDERLQLSAEGRVLLENPLIQMATRGLTLTEFNQIFPEEVCSLALRNEWVEKTQHSEDETEIFVIPGKNKDMGEMFFDAARCVDKGLPLLETLKQRMAETKLITFGDTTIAFQIAKTDDFPTDQNEINQLWLQMIDRFLA